MAIQVTINVTRLATGLTHIAPVNGSNNLYVGSQYDNDAFELVFVRAAEYADKDLVLLFSEGRILIGAENTYSISSAITQNRTNSLQVAFYSAGQDIEHSNILTLNFNPSLDNKKVAPEPTPNAIRQIIDMMRKQEVDAATTVAAQEVVEGLAAQVTIDAGTVAQDRLATSGYKDEAVTTYNQATALLGTVTTEEADRQAAEDIRLTAETNRISAESARKTAEDGRALAEQGRVSAENTRQSNSATAVSNANAATARADLSAQRQPYISENGNWFIWNTDSASYIDTGFIARGPKGEDGFTPARGVDYWTAADQTAIEATLQQWVDAQNFFTTNGEIGFINLLPNTAFVKDSTSWVLPTNVTRDTTKKLDGAVSIKSQQSGLSGNVNRGPALAPANGIECKMGDSFAFSVYIYFDSAASFDAPVRLIATAKNSSDVDVQTSYIDFTPTAGTVGKWTRLTSKVVINASTAVKVVFAAYPVRNGTIWFAKPKLERGGFSTGWAPSPDDLLAVNVPSLTLVEDWIQPTLLNGWREVSGSPVRFCVDAMGFVRFKGGVINSTIQNAGYIMSIPDSYRPLVSTSFVVLKANSFMKVTISSWDTGLGLDGIGVEANTPVYFDQIFYKRK